MSLTVVMIGKAPARRVQPQVQQRMLRLFGNLAEKFTICLEIISLSPKIYAKLVGFVAIGSIGDHLMTFWLLKRLMFPLYHQDGTSSNQFLLALLVYKAIEVLLSNFDSAASVSLNNVVYEEFSVNHLSIGGSWEYLPYIFILRDFMKNLGYM